MGIRKKIFWGFAFLALMLAFSGVVSMVHLDRMGRNTANLLESSSGSIDVSKRMLDAIQEQSTSLLQMIVLGHTEYTPEYLTEKEEFEKALSDAALIAGGPSQLDSLRAVSARYYQLIDNYFSTPGTDVEWFVGAYRTAYLDLTTAVKDYMTSSQRSLVSKARQLHNNAYRALTPGILTTCVVILMMLMFALMLDTYYSKPVVAMYKGLRNFVANRIPFNVKTEGGGEVSDLKTLIEDLINMYKNK